MITLQKNITEEHELGIPCCTIEGVEGNRYAIITIPVKRKSDWVQLESLTRTYSGADFADFYANWNNDKYLVDCVFEQYNIEEDTSFISDFS
jgi:hypothetical protein